MIRKFLKLARCAAWHRHPACGTGGHPACLTSGAPLGETGNMQARCLRSAQAGSLCYVTPASRSTSVWVPSVKHWKSDERHG